MDSTVETALVLAAEIARDRVALKAKEQRFAALIGRPLDRQVHEDDGEQIPLVVDASVAEKIRDTMRGAPGRAFKVSDLRERFPDVDPKLIRGTVNRIARNEVGFQSVGRGVYTYQTPQNGQTLMRPPAQGGARSSG